MTKKASKVKKFEFQGFINVEFSIDERKAIEKWMTAFAEAPVDAVVVLVEAGWKVGVGWDDYHGTNQVSITCKDLGSSYAGYCFTLKHDDIGKGLLVFRYLYDSMLKDELYPLTQKKKDFDW